MDFSVDVIAESEQDAEDVAMLMTDTDLLEGAEPACIYLVGVTS